MTVDLLETYEKMAYETILAWYNEHKEPMIAKQIFEVMKSRKYPKSPRTFKKVLSSLRKQRLVEEKMVTSREYKGKMGYVPSTRGDLTVQEKRVTKKIPKWKIELLTKILKDDKIPGDVKESAAYRLRDCCSYDTSIDSTGEEVLQEFFSRLLDRPRHEDSVYSQSFIAFENFVKFHMSDKLDWILNNYYEKLLDLFETGEYTELRRRALRCLGQILYICQKKSKIAKTKQLHELFMTVFFDPHEGEKIAGDAFENMRLWGDEEVVQNFIKKLYENIESGDEVIKTRCLKCLEHKILPII